MSTRNYSLFYCLLKNLKGYAKEDAVWDFTGGRTTHLSELNDVEYQGLCKHLQSISDTDSDRRRAGSKVLNLLTELGFQTTHAGYWVEIDSFLSNPRIAGKKYRELTKEEHEKLIPKLRALKDKGYQRNQQIQTI